MSEQPTPDSHNPASLPPAPAHDPYAALRVRDFRRLLLARFLSTLGGQMVTVAVGWQLYERTHDPLALGLLGLVEMIPVLLLSLPAGHLSDQGDRKRISIAMRLVLGICTLGLALISWTNGPTALIYACLFAIGVGRAFYDPSASALLPGVVPPELLQNAVTWNSNTWQLASAIGPALGGAVIAFTKGATTAYAFDFVASLVYVVLVSLVHVRREEREREPLTVESLKVGYRFLLQNRLLLSAITLDLFAVLLGGAVALLPVYAKDILKVGPEGLGWMRAAPSVGAVLMAFVIAHLPPFRRAGVTLLWAVAGFGAATVVFGLSRSFPLSLAMLFLLGAFDNVSVVVRSSLLLLRTPDSMRGRVSAVNGIFVGTSNEIGAFESGLVAKLIGPVASVVAGGVGTILVVVGMIFAFPELVRLGRMDAPDEPPTEKS